MVLYKKIKRNDRIDNGCFANMMLYCYVKGLVLIDLAL